MCDNTNFMSEAITQTVTLHEAGHQTKEIMDLTGVSHTSMWVLACVSQLLDSAVHSSHKYLPKHCIFIKFSCCDMRISL